jgi:ABC-2 type transport system permease protein
MSGLAEQFRRSLVIAKKNMKIYYSKGPVIIFGLVFPLFLALAYVIGRNIPLKEVLPGLIGMTTFFTATSVGPSIVPWETRSKTLERLLCCPVALWTIILGDMLSSFIFGIIISTIPLLTTLAIAIEPLNFIILLFGLIIANLCFSALSVLLSAYPPTDIPATSMMLSSLVKFPLVFISGVFIPVEQLPQLGIIIASISPLTYFTDLTRQLILEKGYYPLTLDFAMIVIFAVIFSLAAIKLHEKTLTKRLS